MLKDLLMVVYWLGLLTGGVLLILYFFSYLKIRKQIKAEEEIKEDSKVVYPTFKDEKNRKG